MKKLLITLLLISPFSFADWGDVYYCQMTNSSEISFEEKITNYKLEKFTFKLDKTTNAMVFGKNSNYWRGNRGLLELGGGGLVSLEVWSAVGTGSMLFFKGGKFTWVYINYGNGIETVFADCEKF